MSMFVDQTIFYDPAAASPKGNCTEAAVASILGLPLAAVPDFRADGSDAGKFWPSFRRFLRLQGFEPLIMPGNTCPDVPYLASGPSPRGVSHMVVMRDGALLHDPHPSRAGILSVQDVWLLLPQNPAYAASIWVENRELREVNFQLGLESSQSQIEALEAAAEEIDCGPGCDCGYTEHDTNAFVCPQEDLGECGWAKASPLRELAAAFRSRAALTAHAAP